MTKFKLTGSVFCISISTGKTPGINLRQIGITVAMTSDPGKQKSKHVLYISSSWALPSQINGYVK